MGHENEHHDAHGPEGADRADDEQIARIAELWVDAFNRRDRAA